MKFMLICSNIEWCGLATEIFENNSNICVVHRSPTLDVAKSIRDFVPDAIFFGPRLSLGKSNAMEIEPFEIMRRYTDVKYCAVIDIPDPFRGGNPANARWRHDQFRARGAEIVPDLFKVKEVIESEWRLFRA